MTNTHARAGTPTQLGYLGLGVSDSDAWNEFLTSLLGLQYGGKTDGGAAQYRMDQHRSRIQVHGTGEDDVLYLGWLVASASDLDIAAQRLTDAGSPVERCSRAEAAERGVLEAIRTWDPLGLVNEIGYGPMTLHSSPFQPGRPLDGTFVTGDLGFGHVVLLGGEPDDNMTFYRDQLGLRLTDVVALDGRQPAAFLRANPRHHSLAFPLKTLPAGVRMQHFMVELTELDDVGRAQDLAETRGELEVRLGRHGNDRMVSSYLRSPSGWGVEYGWGAREVSDDAPVIQHGRGDVWGHQLARRESVYADTYGDQSPSTEQDQETT